VKLLNAENLEEIRSFRNSHDCVTEIVFSPDSRWFATADADKYEKQYNTYSTILTQHRCVGIYRLENQTITDPDGEKRQEIKWEFIGHYRAHAKPICSMLVVTQVI